MDLIELFFPKSIQSPRLFLMSGWMIQACIVLRLLRLEPRVSNSLMSKSRGYCSWMREKAVLPSGRIIRKRQQGNFSISILIVVKYIITKISKNEDVPYNVCQNILTNIATSCPAQKIENIYTNKYNLIFFILEKIMKSSSKNQYKSTPHIFDEKHETRQWLRKHGKCDRIMFPEQMLDRLKNYFNSLDEDGSNSISASELQDPLILFGLCKNKAEVENIFRTLDIDGSGEMDFKQFLQVFRRVTAEKRQVKLCKKSGSSNKTFQDFTSTLLGIQGKIEQGISFRLGMSIYRRKHLMRAMMGTNNVQKLQGKQVMYKFQQQISSNPLVRDRLKTGKQMMEQPLPILSIKANRSEFAHRRFKTEM